MLRRLDDAGLLPRGADVARRSIPQEEIAALLAHAVARDSTSAAADYLIAFRREFYPVAPHGITRVDGTMRGYYQFGINRVLAGRGYDWLWTGARPIDDDNHAGAAARTAVASRYVAAAITGENSGISELQLAISSRRIGVWAGRKEVGYAVAHGGGIVLNQHEMDAAGLFLPAPVMVPVLGALRFEMQLTRIDNVLNLNNTENDIEPFFWSARGSIEPHSRLRIGVNRGMIFGGKGNYPITASRLIKNLVGVYTSGQEYGFANQMVSLDVRYRAPLSVPATLYMDWGADDAAGGWWHTPGIAAGFEIGPFAGADLLLGAERTEFGPVRAGNNIWYQSPWLRGSWADDGNILGHPLGGHGKEWRAFAAGGWPARGISGEVTGYVRRRGSQNLFAPQRRGRSFGASILSDARLAPSWYLELRAEVEHGSSDSTWTTSSGRAGVRLRF